MLRDRRKHGRSENGPDSYARRALAEYASGMESGTTRSGLRCPFCNGGRTRENSLSLTRNSEIEILYCCHRASCSNSGVVDENGFRLIGSSGENSNSPSRRARDQQVETMPRGKLLGLGERWLSYLDSSYKICEEEVQAWGWLEDSGSGELWMPIRNSRGIRTGAVIRKPPFQEYPLGPKAKFALIEIGASAAWFVTRILQGAPLVLVEDMFSACKVSRHYNVVSLNGSHISLERITECLDTRPSKIVIALDKDATLKAFMFQKQFGLYGNLKVAVLDRDLKWCDDSEIKERIEGAV